MNRLAQFLIILLGVDAAWVAWGLFHNWIMWPWICLYWVILTLKNLVDYLNWRNKNG